MSGSTADGSAGPVRDGHDHETDHWLAHAHRTLAEAGLRSGAVRNAVMEVLARDGACLRTPQAIIDRVRETHAGGSPGTVYRALEELERHRLIRRVGSPDNVARIEIEHPGNRHHHFLDVASGQVIPFSDAAIDAAVAAVSERLGLELMGYDILLRGTRPVPEADGPADSRPPRIS